MNVVTRFLVMVAASVRIGFFCALVQLPFGYAESEERTPSGRSTKIGLVLEGGGALGFAHVGVLKVLEEARVPVDVIAGTSMGALVGAAYASGRSMDEIMEVLASTDWDRLFDESLPRQVVPFRSKAGREGEILGDVKIGVSQKGLVIPTALVEGQYIEPLLQKLLSKAPVSLDFDELPIPFRAVAADIETGESVVLSKGSLMKAARASMAVPGFFSATEIDGRVLVDGGITNNLPVDVALSMGAERVIAVEFAFAPRKREKLDSPLAISAQILDLLLERSSAAARKLLKDDDLLIQPEVSEFSSASFSDALEIMKRGEAAARAVLPRLKTFAVSESDYQNFKQRREGGVEFCPVIDFVRVEAKSEAAKQRVDAEFAEGKVLGKSLDRRRVDKLLARLHHGGGYQKVSYELEETSDAGVTQNGLVVRVEEKEWLKKYLRLGFAIEDDFNGESNYSLATELRLNEITTSGSFARFQTEIGRSPLLYSEYYQPVWDNSPLFIAPEISLGRQTILARRNGNLVAEYENEVGFGGLKAGITFGNIGEIQTGWRRGPGNIERRIGEESLPNVDYNIGEVFSRVLVDTFDNPDFPQQGVRASFSHVGARGSLGGSDEFDQYRGLVAKPVNLGSFTILGTMEFGQSTKALPIERSFVLGGLFNVSGYEQGSLIADNFWASRATFYNRFSESRSPLLKLGGYYGASLEYSSLRTEAVSVGDTVGLTSGSVFLGFDTPLLPLYVAYGRSSESEQSVYLALGRLLGRRR